MTSGHSRFMTHALGLARQHLGGTWPNPSVGAVLVQDGRIIGCGVTARGGRPHAEAEAIRAAGGHAQGATLYVTLEPCNHHGKTPPCTEAIIQAGIRTVVVACTDPNPLMSGSGIQKLRDAGLEVIEGVCKAQAEALNEGFFSVITRKRPFVALKLATSLDGKIATASGESQWITNQKSRNYNHLLRSQYDAIATGIGTVLADDPLLTCRIPGLEDRSPVRVVFDRQGRLPAASRLRKTESQAPVWVMQFGIEAALAELAARGITRLLVEAGATLSTAFLQSGLTDRIYWFRAPVCIGNDGLAALGEGFALKLSQLPRWHVAEEKKFDSDSLSILECSPAS